MYICIVRTYKALGPIPLPSTSTSTSPDHHLLVSLKKFFAYAAGSRAHAYPHVNSYTRHHLCFLGLTFLPHPTALIPRCSDYKYTNPSPNCQYFKKKKKKFNTKLKFTAMKSALLRTGSVPLRSPALPGSPRGVNLSRNGSGAFSVERTFSSPKISFHLEMSAAVRRDRAPIRRAVSEADVFRSDLSNSGGSQCLQPIIPEEEYVSDGEVDGFLPFMSKGGDWTSYAPIKPEFAVPIEELGFSGNGNGRSGGDHRKSGDGSGDGQFGDRSKIGDYYREMLKLNPGDSLLLRNYGTFLYEVEKDAVKAEECYGRAILANPGDGEVLSLYGKLIWETHGDGERAKSYFDRAAHASPDDCTVLGSYASFMWESGDEDEEEEEVVLPAMAAAV